MDNPKRSIIFCPNIDGHRQNYCCVTAEWFIQAGFQVIIATGRFGDGRKAIESPLWKQLMDRMGVTYIDLGDRSELKRTNWIDLITKLEEKYKPEWTFFPTGDEIRDQLDGLDKTRSVSDVKRGAVFIASKQSYPRDNSELPLIRRIRSNYDWWRYRNKSIRYFRNDIRNRLSLKFFFVTNEDFYREINHPDVYYIPEIYRSWGFNISENNPLIANHIKEYKDYLNKHPDKEVILYYGGWAARRGYDVLLDLVKKHNDTVFVSAGRPTQDYDFKLDIAQIKNDLKKEDRIFEVELPFLPDNPFTDLLFKSSRFMLLPYRDFYGLSGILIQAAAYGKPVLVPSIGYMQSVVRKHQIGQIFQHNDISSFTNEYRVFRKNYINLINNTRKFSIHFSKDKIDLAFQTAIATEHPGKETKYD